MGGGSLEPPEGGGGVGGVWETGSGVRAVVATEGFGRRRCQKKSFFEKGFPNTCTEMISATWGSYIPPPPTPKNPEAHAPFGWSVRSPSSEP